MFKLPESLRTAKHLGILMTGLAMLRRYRQKRGEAISLRTRIAYYRNLLRRKTLSEWPGAYVMLESGDYFYVPKHVDVMGGYTLLKPLVPEPLIKKFCPKNGVVVDIGANIGHWTVQMAHAVGPQGRVYAFEPIPYIREALNKTLRANMLQHVQLNSQALSDENGDAVFSIEKFNSGGSRIGVVKEGSEQIDIKTIRFDDYCRDNNIEHIDFIKIDVEGFEASVLDGARETLQRLRPALVFETGHEDIAARQRISNLLKGINYELIGVILPDGIAETSWDNLINWQGELENSGVINVLCLPR